MPVAVADADALAGRVNLLEILAEDHESVPPPPDHAVSEWSEDDIERYYATNGVESPPTKPQKSSPSSSSPTPTTRDDPARLRAAFPPADDVVFRRWFPGLKRSGTEVEDSGGGTTRNAVKLTVLCFANAGNAEDMYTNEGLGARRAASPLLEWCRANDAEVLAAQLPGRGTRLRDDFIDSAAAIARALLPVIGSRLIDAPYVVIGHSVGTWLGHEFVEAAREAGLPSPRRVFFSNFPDPGIPKRERPWTPNRGLTEDAFKDEARTWDVNEMVFTHLWKTYHSIMRHDFVLFDEYPEPREDESSRRRFDFPMTMFYGTRDRKVTRAMVAKWRAFARGNRERDSDDDDDDAPAFECVEIEGNHLFPLEPGAKTTWLRHIAERLDRVLASSSA